ncbi:MAG: RNA-binding protein [Deltaproteobacteria bacterium]|nr:RNA-binding protein [Deltaproteobacteria bacterium]
MAKKLYVGNLSYKTSEDDLREAFAAAGEIQSVKIITDETGRSKGFGFIEMANDEEAAKAISTLNGSTLMERSLIVNEARPQTEKGRPSGKGRPGGGGGGGSFGGKKGRW